MSTGSELVRCRDCGARVARDDAFSANETEYRCADCNEAAWERHYDRMDDPPATTYYTDEGILFRRVGHGTPEVWHPKAARWTRYDRDPLTIGNSLSEAEARERFPAAFVEWAVPNDIAEWADKSTAGAYPPGHRFTVNGREFDPAEADSILGGPDADG